MLWIVDIVRAMRELGGRAELFDLYREVAERRGDSALPDNYKSSIRATLQSYCSDSRQYKAGYPDLFANPSRGIWCFRDSSTAKSCNLPANELIFEALVQLSANELQSVRDNEGELQAMLFARLAGSPRT